MKIWKFIGVTSRQALRQVKEKLGPDALIISNRPVEGGVEMAALAGGDVAAFEASPEPIAIDAPAVPAAPSLPVLPDIPAAEAPAKPRAARKPRRLKREPRESERAARTRSGDAASITSAAPWAQELTRTLMREIESMRGTLESQLAALVFGDPRAGGTCAPVLNRMLGSGFTPGFARKLLLELPPTASETASREATMEALAARLHTASAEDDIVRRGSVYALIGPTGVGKTTTTAKIAARCVVRHGAENVALLTTDTYRIGAHEQLRIYARLLGLAVHTVRDANELRTRLSELRGRHIVLIDTMGMSQRDQMVSEHSAMLMSAGVDVRQVLLLNATCSTETLHDVVRAYRAGAVRDCVITKADEAATLGAPLEVAIRERLVVHYVANGQRVPEDLHAADGAHMVHAAFEAAASIAPGRRENEGWGETAASALIAPRTAAASTL
jgi:flagellar biosynthesis protein FlhF